MKKLLLFIILFTLASFTAMANYDPKTGTYDYGCGAGIPPDACNAGNGGGGGFNPGYTYPRHFGAVAIDIETGYWSSATTYTSKKEAKESVVSRCGENCKLIMVSPDSCVGIAYSKEDKILGYDASQSNTKVKTSNEKALKKCDKNGGSNCKVLVNVCAYDGTTEY